MFSDEELECMLLASEQPGELDALDSIFLEPVESVEEATAPEEASEPEEEKTQEGFDWTEATRLLEEKDSKAPVKLTYQLLVRQVKLLDPVGFNERSIEAWYLAVRRWCKHKGLSLRTTNRSTPSKPKVLSVFRKYKHSVSCQNKSENTLR